MKNLYNFLLLLFFGSILIPWASAQTDVVSGEVFFNRGSTTGGVSQYYYSSYTVGQPLVGPYFGSDYQGALGFWSRFLVAPGAPFVTVSEGDFSDRILLEWDVDPLSPASSNGFKVFRDGAFLASLDPTTLEFIDFNVVPGNFYNYEVRGVNSFGEGYPAWGVGFVNPNGSVTGQVTSINGNPVADVQVTLSPTIGKSLSFDGIDNQIVIPHHPDYTDDINTVSFWVKINDGDEDVILDLGKNTQQNWWVTTATSGDPKGVIIGVGATATAVEFPIEFTDNPDDWHQIAFTFNGSDLNAYLDGALKGSLPASMTTAVQDLFVGTGKDIPNSNFDGKIDDLRIFNRQLSQTEIIRTMEATVPSNAEGLVAYWKLDEGTGRKIFDLTENQLDGRITGAEFSDDRPNILNAGVTDESGYYLIDGINYGGGQNFTARPSKNFEFNNGLEFNATNSQYALISDFTPADTGTIEIWFKPSALTGNQTILSNANFDLSLDGANLNLEWNGGSSQTVHTFTGTDYLHFALTYIANGGSPNMEVYINGNSVQTFSGSTVNWNNSDWSLARDISGNNYFSGLIDEIVFYKSARTQPQIQNNASEFSDGVEITDLELHAFFSLNESVGTNFSDQSPNNTGTGIIHGASWTSVTARPETVPHEFDPISRIVTLNPSSTGVDNVNFKDISTVSVSGFVRYAGTACFAEGTEILVNGNSHTPPIYTDSLGQFVADFEPGASVRLSPTFKDHSFIPAFWDINNIVVPKAGFVFNNQETRDIEGIIAGGLCHKSIIPPGGSVTIALESQNGCYTKNLVISEPTGKFDFDNVPPLAYNVSIINHPVAPIKEFFQTQGGQPIDVADTDTSLFFIYRADPQIQLSEFPINCNGDQFVNQFSRNRLDITVYEDYFGSRCILDSVNIQIDNDIATSPDIDSTYRANKFRHTFFAGPPNILSPYKKGITITATDAITEKSVTESMEAVVLGKRERVADFTSASPEIPLMILRDPPGDQSYAYISEGDQFCTSFSMAAQLDESTNVKTTLSLGPEFELGSPFNSTEFDFDADLSLGVSASSSYTTEYEQEMCITATSTLQTQADEIYPGSEMGGDLFVGAAINFIYGGTDVLLFNDTTCTYELDYESFVRPDGFATEYVYSEAHIRNVLIPELEGLNDSRSVAMWQQVLAKNEATKANAIFDENRSFDAGVIYEFETTTERAQSTTYDFEVTMTEEIATVIGFKSGGIGSNTEVSFNMGLTFGNSTQSSSSSATTIGYHLEDNDPGDNFTINILKDKVYGTPVFQTVSGQSSCPHEPNTQHRDEVSIQMLQTTQTNVPETEAAVFNVIVGNTNPAEQRRVYNLEVDQSSNPDGAIIKVNGQPASSPIAFDLEYGESREVTVTVEKGPVEYDYTDLEIELYAACEADRAEVIGADTDSLFSQSVTFNAHFIESCSDIRIGSPLDGWVMTPEMGDSLSITLNGYDKDDSDFELARVQYRRVGGNGAWINISEIPKDSLGNLFEIVYWNIGELTDGPYEIRSVTQCSGGLPAGVSEVIPGRLERQPPALLGIPQPSDGVLDIADQIYIEFSENVNCNNLNSLSETLDNFVGLFFAETGEPIDITISCNENRIFLNPNIQNRFIEDQLLRAKVNGIKDLVGNTIPEPIEWEFYVNRNPLKWVEGDIADIKYEDESWLVTRTIRNTGGQTEAFNLENVPSWLTVSTTSGEILPGETSVIVFSVDDNIPSGHYVDTIQLANSMGDKPLVVDLGALCRPPVWEITPSDYDYNMTFTVELNIEGEVSEDEFDQVAAFVDGDIRGKASVEYVPALDKYMAFLTVYSNQIDGEELNFRIWDASDCLLYGTVVETYTFTNDGLHGTPANPDVLHTNNILLKEIPVHDGWNWISFNLDMPDKSIGAVLESLDHPQDVLVKDQVSFSQYFNALDIWAGSLQNLGYTSMYQFKGTQNDTIVLLGHPIDPDTVDIPINVGWNWIGYLPQRGASVDTALASLTPLDGDIVKNQTSFAQYVAGVGWIGSLTTMEAPNGYLLKSSVPGILLQPTEGLLDPTQQALNNVMTNPTATIRSSGWDVNPSQFEHSMTLVGIVEADDVSMLKEGDEVAAFVGDDVRGVTSSLYVEQLDIHLLFLTVYANELDEELSFKYFDGETEMIYDLIETISFEANGTVGSVSIPEILTMEVTSINEIDREVSLSIQPNPFTDRTNLNFVLPTADEVTIKVMDVLGNVVRTESRRLNSGVHNIEILSVDDNKTALIGGTYIISIEGRFGKASEKVILMR